MTRRQEKADVLARLDEYLERIGLVQERDPEIVALTEELEMVGRAETGALLLDHAFESQVDGIITQWKEKERNARRNLDAAFFDKVARALRTLKLLGTEVNANSPPAHLAAVAALQAIRLISKHKTLPSWEYIRAVTELILAGRHALTANAGSPEDVPRFKALALKELTLFRKRARDNEVKWNLIRNLIGLKGLLRDRLSPRERKKFRAFKAKMLP